MPLRSTRKYYRKRSSKGSFKRKFKFTKYNLYKKSGAKAQASQIYSLNKKVNRMYKNLKQDIDTKIIKSNVDDMLLYNNTVQVQFKSVSYAILGSATFEQLQYASSGTSTGGVATTYSVPDAVLIKKVNFYIHWRFTSPTYMTQPVYLRVVIVRYKTNQTAILSNTDVLNENTEAIIKVKGPLHSGLRDSGFYVIGDYKFKMKREKGNIDSKIKIPGCKLQKGELLYPKGSTFAIIATYNPAAAASNDDQFTTGNIYSKIVYTNPSFVKTI